MFSVRQKQKIAEDVQRILRETNHSELPKREIQFSLHVDGAESWSWADIKNNGAVLNPPVNPWNEMQDKGTPPEPQHGREPDKVKPECKTCKDSKQILVSGYCNMVHKYVPCPDCQESKPKPLAQYLMEYIEHETGMDCHYGTWRELLEQALDVYQSTENVTIKIERI